MSEIAAGSWVEVLPEYDIPLVFRPDGKPSCGRVERVHEDGTVIVWIDGDGAAVPYRLHEVRPASRARMTDDEVEAETS